MYVIEVRCTYSLLTASSVNEKRLRMLCLCFMQTGMSALGVNGRVLMDSVSILTEVLCVSVILDSPLVLMTLPSAKVELPI